MHDGYLFTLGICGTASGNSAAPALLGRMLAAIPPVKRAALLGEIVLLDDPDRFADPMLEAVLAEMDDAELLLIVTPTRHGRLPARLEELLTQATTRQLQGKYALAIILREADMTTTVVGTIRRFAALSGLHLIATLELSEQSLDPQACVELEALARRAYDAARTLAPNARP